MPGLLDALMFQNSPLGDMPMVGGLLAQPGGPLSFRDRIAPMTNAQEYGTATSGPAGPAGNPLAGMPQTGVPMPQARPDAMPQNATPTAGQSPPMSMAPPSPPPPSPDITAPVPGDGKVPETSLLGRIGGFLGAHPQMLMKMAAGFSGAPNLGQGMSRAMSGGAAGMKDDREQAGKDRAQAALGDTYQALVKAGVPPAQALAAVAAQQGGNPALLTALGGKHLGAQRLMDVDGQLRDPLTGEIRGQGPAKLVTIQDPTTGMPTSALQHPDGRMERVAPQSLPMGGGTPPVQVNRVEDALKLPKGTPFVDPFGVPRVR